MTDLPRHSQDDGRDRLSTFVQKTIGCLGCPFQVLPAHVSPAILSQSVAGLVFLFVL
ncbi:hypothetical protein K439DRAFT_1629990 [Ramaria rubella]|nr:hypothetical protein K439DRAFT_1629990 [Ramaria rubella]